MSSDFEVAAAIVQHQITQALPTISPVVKFVEPTLQIRTTHSTFDKNIVRSVLIALKDCRDALHRLPIETSDMGWSDMQIVRTYAGLGQVCLLILIGFYGFQFLRTVNFGRSPWLD